MAPPPDSVNAAPPTVADAPRRARRPPAPPRAEPSGSRGLDQIARLVLAEPARHAPAVRRRSGSSVAPLPPAIAISAMRDEQPAIGNVMAGGDTARARSAPRTKSPLRRSAARSTGGGGPSSRPSISRRYSEAPRWPRGLADQHQRIAVPLQREIDRACRRRRSARRRRSPGSAGSRCRSSRCRATHCPRRPGSRAPGRPRACLRCTPANSPMISGFSGLPKFMLSVSASGSAPTAVRLRQLSATACMPPRTGSARQ